MNKLMTIDNSDNLYILELIETNKIAYDETFKIVLYNNYPMYGYIISNYGRMFSSLTRKQLLGTADKDGYIHTTISNLNFQKPKRVSIHRLVLMTFHPILNPEMFQVNHINGIKSDNRLINLEWCTALENIHHAWNTGLSNSRGDNHPFSVFSEEIIHDFCRRLENGQTYQEICDDYGIINKRDRLRTRDIISKIIKKETFVYISSSYNIPDSLPYNRKRLDRIGIDIDDIHYICKSLEDGKTYREISNDLYEKDNSINIQELKDLMYSIVSGDSYQHISRNYNIQKPKSEKHKLFTDDQIHIICKELAKGKKSNAILLDNFGIDLDSIDSKRKHCILNCISNIKTKKQFKYISDLYF